MCYHACDYMEHIRTFIAAHRIWLLGGLLVIGLGWLFFGRGSGGNVETLTVKRGEFLQQVSISGKVVAAKDVDLGFTQGGRVASVGVSVGNRVSAGTVVASLENGELRAAVLQKQAALDSQEAKLASLKAGTRAEQIAVTQSQVASSEASLLDSIRDAYRSADNAVHNTADQFFNNPRTNPKLTFSITDTQLGLKVESERVSMELLLSSWQHSVALLGIDDPKKAALEAQNNLGQVSAFLSDANDALNHGIPTLSTPNATFDTWISAVGTARSALNSASSAITSDATALETQRKTLLLQQAGATAEDIAAQEAQVQGARADLESARAQLQKTLIVAPFAGVVTTVNAKVGSIASPDAPQISMISDGAFQVETFIPEINVVNVQVGNEAVVMLDAYGAAPFAAKVVSIDPAETIHDGVSTYKTTLQFVANDSRIRSGMTASTMITTARVPDAIAIPKAAVYEKDDASYVKVKTDRGVVERVVKVGPVSALGSVVIESGLSEGELLVLSKK